MYSLFLQDVWRLDANHSTDLSRGACSSERLNSPSCLLAAQSVCIAVTDSRSSHHNLSQRIFVSSSSWWLSAFPDVWLRHSNLCLHGPVASASVCLLCVSPLRTVIIGFRIHLDDRGQSPYLKIFKLITFPKAHFPNKVIFIGLGNENMDISFFWGGRGNPSTLQLPNEYFEHCTQMTQCVFFYYFRMRLILDITFLF